MVELVARRAADGEWRDGRFPRKCYRHKREYWGAGVAGCALAAFSSNRHRSGGQGALDHVGVRQHKAPPLWLAPGKVGRPGGALLDSWSKVCVFSDLPSLDAPLKSPLFAALPAADFQLGQTVKKGIQTVVEAKYFRLDLGDFLLPRESLG